MSFRDYSIIGVFIETTYFIGDSGKINFPGSQGAGMAGNNDNALLDSDKKQCGGKVWNLNAGCGLVSVFLNQQPVFGIGTEQLMGKRDENRFAGKLPQLNLRL